MIEPGRWSDLAARLGSAAVMVVLGLGAVGAGGDVFHVFVALVCGAMVWELVRMLAPETPSLAVQLSALSGCALLLAIYLPPIFALPVLLAPVPVGAGRVPRDKRLFAAYVTIVLLAGFEMMRVRDDFGFTWMLWLITIVVASDVAGYFGGKALGGPKFWPRISPKKTWSGTVAGWLAAGLVGLGFVVFADAPWVVVPYSILTAFAAQMGDIGESAIKRHVGVKDSSALIPGHGGLLDRFDGMLGASVFVLLTAWAVGIPPGAS
jgi:phosphatidate cytidylyltransferase